MNMPLPPKPPDYDKIIEEELAKIGGLSLKQEQNKKIDNQWYLTPYKNPAYNDALVEAFEAIVQSKLDDACKKYTRELELYEANLKKYKCLLEEKITQKKAQHDITITDFETAKEFYDKFHLLVNKKFNYIYNTFLKLLDNEKNSEVESEEK